MNPATFDNWYKVSNQLAKNLVEDESSNEIVEAQGWIINDRGNVELVTEPPAQFSTPTYVPCNK